MICHSKSYIFGPLSKRYDCAYCFEFNVVKRQLLYKSHVVLKQTVIWDIPGYHFIHCKCKYTIHHQIDICFLDLKVYHRTFLFSRWKSILLCMHDGWNLEPTLPTNRDLQNL